MAEQLTDQSVAGASSAPAGKKKLLVIIAAITVVLLAGGAAAFFMLSTPAPVITEDASTPEAAAARARTAGPVQYLDLSPAFTINFPHQGRQRFLQANLSVMSRDTAALLAVSEHMPLIRHNLINLFSAQLLLVFEDPSGIERLRALATQEVREVLMSEIGRDGIEEVLFTTFVLQ